MKPLTNSSAEQLLIGSVISTPGAIDLVAEKLGPGDFHEPRIGVIYSAVARLALSGKSGSVALIEELRAAGELSQVGGDKAISFLEGKAVKEKEKIVEAAQVVRDLAGKRERAAKAYRVAHAIAQGGDAGEDLDALLSDTTTDREGWTDLGGVIEAIVQGTHRRLEPTILRRQDGHHLLYAGKLNWIASPPESMKSFLAKLACVQLLEQGKTVVYVDFEESDGTTCAERIVTIALGLGHPIDRVRDWVEGPEVDGKRDREDRLFFYRAATTGLDTASRAQIIRLVRSRQVPLVVLDGVAAAMGAHQPPLDENVARDVNLWLAGFAHPLVSLGAGVFCVDHVVKNSAPGNSGSFASRGPRGSGSKLAAVSGTALTSIVESPGSAWSVGKVAIDVLKDRPGRVKIVVNGSRRMAGKLVSTPKTGLGNLEVTHLAILSPEQVAEADAEKRWDLICAQQISQVLENAGDPMSKTEIKETLNERRAAKGSKGWKNDTVTAAFSFLISQGWATMEKDGKNQMLAIVKPYLSEFGDRPAEDGNPF